jgi:antitoxin ParD1/3/4
MNAYRKYITIDDPRRVVLEDLPFRQGQRVEVVFLAEDERDERLHQLQALLRDTQALPQAKILTEEELAQEIEEYRAGR